MISWWWKTWDSHFQWNPLLESSLFQTRVRLFGLPPLRVLVAVFSLCVAFELFYTVMEILKLWRSGTDDAPSAFFIHSIDMGSKFFFIGASLHILVIALWLRVIVRSWDVDRNPGTRDLLASAPLSRRHLVGARTFNWFLAYWTMAMALLLLWAVKEMGYALLQEKPSILWWCYFWHLEGVPVPLSAMIWLFGLMVSVANLTAGPWLLAAGTTYVYLVTHRANLTVLIGTISYAVWVTLWLGFSDSFWVAHILTSGIEPGLGRAILRTAPQIAQACASVLGALVMTRLMNRKVERLYWDGAQLHR